jgi:VCBS repeat-containing protein
MSVYARRRTARVVVCLLSLFPVLLSASPRHHSLHIVRPSANNDVFMVQRGGTLTLPAPGLMANDFGMPALLRATMMTPPAHGTATLSPDGTLTYRHDGSAATTDVLTYKINDTIYDSDEGTVRIEVVSAAAAPIATADHFTVADGGTLRIPGPGVLANDTDPRGNSLFVRLVSGPSHGSLTLGGNGSFVYTRTAPGRTSDSFVYIASNGAADSAPATVSIDVTASNAVPLASGDQFQVEKGGVFTLAAPGVLANDHDPDGGALSARLITGPEHGSLALAPSGAITYMHDGTPTTTDHFTYVATDGQADSAPATVLITIVNTAPVAGSDVYSATAGGTLTIPAPGILANDADADGDVLSAALVAPPAHGTLTLSANGSFVYHHDGSAAPLDSFTYTASDGQSSSAAATVTIRVLPAVQPPAGNADFFDVPRGGNLTLAAPGVLGNDMDPQGNPLSVALVSGPSHGTVRLAADGSLVYQNDNSAATSDSITYRASNGAADSAPVLVTFRIVTTNQPPLANGDVYAVTRGGVLSFNAPGVLGNDSDPRGAALVATLVMGPFHGQVTLNPDGSFTYQNDGSAATTDFFRYTAGDGSLVSAAATVTIAVNSVATAPVAAADNYTVVIGGALTVASPGVLSNDLDAGGNPLTSILVTTTSHGALMLHADGSFTYVHDGSAFPTDSFSYRANNGQTDSSIVTVTITVAASNPPPTAAGDSYAVARGASLSVAAPGVLGNDTAGADHAALSAVPVTPPAHGTLVLNPDGSFVYQNDGTAATADTFTYKATDGHADSSPATAAIAITATNQAPSAVDDAYSVVQGGTLTIVPPGVLANDSDPDHSPLSARPINVPAHGSLTFHADGSLTYHHDGSASTSDSFTYVANDGQADSAPAVVRITITPSNHAPLAVNDAYATGQGQPLTNAAPGVLGNDSDPDHDTLHAILVAQPLHGTVVLDPSGAFAYTPAAGFSGSDSFTYKANDGTADSNTASVTITVAVALSRPVANDDGPYALANRGTFTLPAPGVLANDDDFQGLPLTAQIVTQPQHGTLTFNSNGGFTYVHDGSLSLTDSFTYQANDGSLSSIAATVRLTIGANAAPTGVADSYSLAHGATLTVAASGGVLSNDTDVDDTTRTAALVSGPAHGTLTLGADGAFTYVHDGSNSLTDSFVYHPSDGHQFGNDTTVTLTIGPDAPPVAVNDAFTTAEDTPLTVAASGVLSNDTDADTSPGALTAVVVTQPAHGTLALGANGGFTYTPAANYNGPDSFTYKANDAILDSNAATVTITVTAVNDAPVAVADSYTTLEDTPLTIAAAVGVLSNDSDVDTAAASLTANLVAGPAHGTLALSPNGGFTYTPAANYNGPDSFTYKTNDGALDSSVATVSLTITAVNDAPSFTAGAAVTVLEDSGAYSAAQASGISAGPADEASQTLSFIVTNSNNALFAVQPSLSPSGVLTFTPAANANGSATITATLRDNGGTANGGVDTTAPQTFTINLTAVNDAPSFTAGAAVLVLDTVGAQSVSGWATALSAGPADESGQALNFIVSNDNNALFTTQPSVAPNGTLTFTPVAGQSGVANVTVQIHDNGGVANGGVDTSAAQTFTITIDKIPVITSVASVTFTVGQAGSFDITTLGRPKPTIARGGVTLPAGISYVDNGNGTATLSGTPAAATGGNYALTFVATNVHGSSATQSFTLTVDQAAAITSANSVTFTAGTAGTFTITTSGFPLVSTIGEVGGLPAGVTFTNNGDGTATLAGTAGALTGGSYPITLNASNGVGTAASQSFTLTVDQAPAITSGNSATFGVGQSGTFTVTATGFPAPTLSESGTLPSGITFNPATGALSGTAAAGTGGTYLISFKAANGVGTDAVQSFTLTINQAAAITSAASATFTTLLSGTFTVTTSGFPLVSTIAEVGGLPSGITFTNNGDGTATIAGTPAALAGGSYPIVISASNGVGTGASQNFTLVVDQPPAITSGATATFTAGVAGSFTVSTTGFPTPAITRGGAALPSGVTFVDNGNGTGTLSGTPVAATGGTYVLTFTAANGVSPDAGQSFTLTVDESPVISSATATTFLVGTPGTFTVTTTAVPTVTTITETGALPGGVTFTDNHDGTATIAGTPNPLTGGLYPITLTASNGVGTAGTQNFTLTIDEAPSITSINQATFQPGVAGTTFTVTTTGFPSASSMVISESGALPGGLTFTDNHDGTATIAGTATGSGTFPIVITASNGVSPDATQNFTIKLNQPPAITSANNATFKVGQAGTFTVTSTGLPTATLSESGSLPTGVTFTPHADGTATLAGTPAAGTGGTFTIVITATNAVAPDATQSFTLTVQQAPAITSGNSTTFKVGAAGTFTVTTTGFPTGASMLISETGGLPSGVTFVDNHDGTATLAGTPAASTGGLFTLTITANNGVTPNATQSFTLTVQEAPAITSAATTTFQTGQAGTFAVTATGFPTAGGIALSETGTLPSGVTFVDNHDGTATLAGTPGAATGGSFPITITANNGVTPNAAQSFTLVVNQPPAITSANNTTFKVGTAGTFSVTTTGFPTNASMVISESGALPAGVTLVDNHNGTATLAGTPNAGTGGSFSFTITANNGVTPNATQSFTLTVQQAPAITSAATTTFQTGQAGTFTVTATGFPTAGGIALSETGALPSGVTFVDNHDGTATLAGTPGVAAGGSFPITITANNGVTPNATQSFTLVVNQPPAITSLASATFKVGTAGAFSVTTTGFPTGASMVITETGALPGGVTFVDNHNGTATLAGTPNAGTGGSFPFTITANNGVAPNATQSFILTVQEAPTVTSANAVSFTAGIAGTFTVTTSGSPTVTAITEVGSLPTGVTFVDNHDGTATLAGTPGAATGGAYPIAITAVNGVTPNGTQTFTITVNQAPLITSVNTVTFVPGVAGTFNVTTSGFPTGASMIITESGTLPSGVTFTDNHNGTATLAGTPGPNTQTGSPYTLTFSAANGTTPNASQTFTLNVICPTITVSGTIPLLTFNTAMTPVTFTTSGGNGTTAWSAPALPAGLTIGTATGVVSGTPTVTGSFTVIVTATDGFGCSGSTSVSFNIQPKLVGDGYNGVGNTQFFITGVAGAPTTPAVSSSLGALNNDSADVAIVVTAGTFSTAAGGSITIDSVGRYIYTPPLGFTGSDTFTYIGTTHGVSATAVISWNLTNRVWFVNNAAAAGDGRSNTPLNSMTALNTAATAANDNIYVELGSGATAGSFTMKASQILTGNGATLNVGGLLVILGTPGSNSILSGGLTLASGAKVDGVDMDGAGVALTGTSVTTVSVNIGRFRRTGSSGTAAITIGGTGNTGNYDFKSISATGLSGATKGVTVSNLTGHFIVAGTDAGVTPNGGTISGYGGNGVEFKTVANGAAPSVSLTKMTLSGNGISQTVAGSATTCGGNLITSNNLGCVANLFLQAVTKVALNTVTISNSGQMGIVGNSVTDLTIGSSTITSNGNEQDEDGINIQNLFGACSITDTNITNNATRQVYVENDNGTVTLSVTKTAGTMTVGNTSRPGAVTTSAQGILFSGHSATNMTLQVDGITVQNNFSNGIQSNIQGASSLNGFIQNSSFSINAAGINLQNNNSSTIGAAGNPFLIQNNPVNVGNQLQGINVGTAALSTGAVTVRISGNVIGTTGVSGSACDLGFPGGAQENCAGISLSRNGTNPFAVTVSSNNIRQFGNNGITMNTDQTGSVAAALIGNTIAEPYFRLTALGASPFFTPGAAIVSNMGTSNAAGMNACVDINSNNIDAGVPGGGGWDPNGNGAAILTEARNSSIVHIPGYAGGDNLISVQNFIIGANAMATPSGGTKVKATHGSVVGAFANGIGACSTP